MADLKIDCVQSQGDYISITDASMFYGEKSAYISICENSISEYEATIRITKYSAEQIIKKLKQQFGL